MKVKIAPLSYKTKMEAYAIFFTLCNRLKIKGYFLAFLR